MNEINNYLAYRKHKPEYINWKKDLKQRELQRQSYISKNNISNNDKQSDIKRAQIVLDAVDIMDEYSQTKAEDMENAVQGIQSFISPLICYGGMGVGLLLGVLAMKLPFAKNFDKEQKGVYYVLSLLLGELLAGTAGGLWFSSWSVKKETEASRKGRFEAMTTDLNNSKHFAQLNDAQEKQLDEIAKTIKIDEKEAKKVIKKQRGTISGIFNSIKEIRKPDIEYIKERKAFNENLNKDKTKFDSVKLSEAQILEAKKDQQLIQNIVEKVDVASQEYAEDVELFTDSIGALTVGSTGFGAIIGSIISKGKQTAKSAAIGGIIGMCLSIPFIIMATRMQKQASRVARWKVKQDFLNNPEKLYYVDDDKVKSEKVEVKDDNKKIGYFAKLKQILDDDKKYNEYLKQENIKGKQRQKAIEKIEITPEQEKRAKQLQNNVFKMFNKVDEKSQMYSESTEALGQMVSQIITLVPGIALIIASFVSCKNYFSEAQEKSKQGFLAPIIASIFTAIPAIGINIYSTKEQKNASKVADMLAIKEMNDYRNFADYSNSNPEQNQTNPNETASKTSSLPIKSLEIKA